MGPSISSGNAISDDIVRTIEILPAFPRLPNFSQGILFATHAGDGSNRLFVVQQSGLIHVLDNRPDTTEATVFMDITNKVSSPSSGGGSEEGLLGLAFDPNFLESGTFYVYYSAAQPRRSIIARYRINDDGEAADLASEEIILTFEQPFSNHNGGWMAFGEDGFLYIAVGDGGSGGDPQGNAQNRETLLGTILRIDPSISPFRIPDDNPFVAQNNVREEIWAYGLRNPWRCSFDRLNGDLWCGDVGQNSREEIDQIFSGGNYGWNLFEGSLPFSEGSADNLELPIFEYGRSDGQSITGGYVYRGELEALQGQYVYGDFVSGRIWALNLQTRVSTEIVLDDPIAVASFAEDENGEVYIIDYSGEIYRFRVRAVLN